jgi:hypothetical protein
MGVSQSQKIVMFSSVKKAMACPHSGDDRLKLLSNSSNSDLHSSPAREWFSAVSFDFADSS